MEKIICDSCKGTGIDPKSINEPCKKCSGFKKLDWIQNATGIEITREEKCLLFAIKTLNELSEMGVLSNGGLKIDENAKIILEDFEPTTEELEKAINILKQEGYIS